MKKGRVRVPHKLLLGSVFFFLVGIGLLLVTTGLLPRYEDLWPIPLTLLGLLFIYLVRVNSAPPGYIVPGILFSLGGLLLTLKSLLMPDLTMERIWPLFMTFAGVSLAIYGRGFKGSFRVKILVPAVVMIILSLLFLPFSLELVRENFSSVVTVWWPLLFIFLSLGLFGEYLRKKKK
ncbi:hypothetical protein B4O97_14735 [Marispirochaeta aestuarii]|uniref:DUF5668 domain-containing protein n=1 Tax=Marispirochaeta aestuarii TaxID=1963862 RepID=A0A1Y1RVD2_9SPIO|nr:hypothetical protein [Marispirochaeta aestuarii]ORC33914.1 hypothetical protein B4O97_14735 [Marispirochaeta aestuarii]